MSINECAIEQEAEAVVVEVGAVKPCPVHRDVLINQCDPGADKHAYALATSRWKAGSVLCPREDLMTAIDYAINLAADECPRCMALVDA